MEGRGTAHVIRDHGLSILYSCSESSSSNISEEKRTDFFLDSLSTNFSELSKKFSLLIEGLIIFVRGLNISAILSGFTLVSTEFIKL